jgi:hypothetical protein
MLQNLALGYQDAISLNFISPSHTEFVPMYELFIANKNYSS